ncbi:DNA-binding response regulator (plasmid) [Brasilonema octagenarum UFV-E1]|uniref:DNA-binding response regulator n=2 Tax=Brasilonema TaxID=383614 RepID=A0A856MR31_9CYAN|nr:MULTISPECIES: response regulator transcription factor [Brasilonema]NMF62532.1 DNA-binding response regulator [Brasilonema octagenarum UFV-OR1]QDL12784.1 DNA-binding response regulator [Brasilonema sennae CENA114]QDL19180.1 DNA-binding response regulator [Brasilonema octagenarum UFV-E1]
MTTTQKVLIVDDEQRFRQGLRTLLNFYNVNASLSIEVVGEAASLEQVLKLTIQHNPNLILLDLELVSSDGISVLIGLKEISYAGKVLVLSAHQEDNWIYRAMQAGAAGYIFKSRLVIQLYEAIDKVIKSEVYFPAEVANGFFRHFQAKSESDFKACQKLHLTEREQEVLYWLAQGASNEEIAKKLYVTVATVKAHLTSIFEKLKVTSRTQAIVTAIKLGIVQA